jgi:hypothetical protein
MLQRQTIEFPGDQSMAETSKTNRSVAPEQE